MTTPSEFEPAVLDTLRKLGGEDLLRRLIGVFSTFGRDKVAAAVAAGAQGDLPAVALAAHAVRSSAGNVGAVRLHEVATALEAAAHDGKAAEVPALVADLRASFDAAHTWLTGALEAA